MTRIPGPTWWRPYETVPRSYMPGAAASTGTPSPRLSSGGHKTPRLQSYHDGTKKGNSPHYVTSPKLAFADGPSGCRSHEGNGEILCRRPHPQHSARTEGSTTAYLHVERPHSSLMSFRRAPDTHQSVFKMPPYCKTIRQCIQKPSISRRSQPCTLHNTTPLSYRDTPCSHSPPKCSPRAASPSQDRRTSSPTEPLKRSLALTDDPSDRLRQVEHILDQLIHEAQVLRIENFKLRAARVELGGITGLRKESGVGNCAARLRCEVNMLRRKLREQDEKLRSMRHEAAYMDVCREQSSKLMLTWEDEKEGQTPEDEALKERLLSKEEALKKSEQEASALRSELARLKDIDASNKSELQELRARCKELNVRLLEGQQDSRCCAIETVTLGAEVAAARGAQLSKTWEFTQMERRLQRQLNEQVEGRLSLQADKQKAETELERLRVAFRSLEERAVCQAEQLLERDEEVQLLQQQVENLCRQREHDTTKLQEQGATMIRWRSYIRFLEKLIRDLRSYIINQARASSAGSVHGGHPRALAVSAGHRNGAPLGSNWQGQAPERARSPSKDRDGNKTSRQVETEMSKSLAAVGYNLLPLPFSPYEPSLDQQLNDWPATFDRRCRMGERLGPPRTPQQSDESGSIAQLGRLMKQAAEELRLTAAAARRGQSPNRYGPRRLYCNRSALGGGSSPGSTEASSIGTDATPTFVHSGGPASIRGEVNERLEGLQRRNIISPAAQEVSSESLSASDRGSLGTIDVGRILCAGTRNGIPPLGESPGDRRRSCVRWLNKGSAASHLAKEISVRFPAAFERLQKTNPLCKLLSKTTTGD